MKCWAGERKALCLSRVNHSGKTIDETSESDRGCDFPTFFVRLSMPCHKVEFYTYIPYYRGLPL